MPVSILLIFLSLMDLFAGVLVFFRYFPWFQLILYIALIYIVKGIGSVVSSIAVKYYLDWMGVIDFITGVTLLLIYYKIIFPFFWIVAIAQIIKSLYSLALSI